VVPLAGTAAALGTDSVLAERRDVLRRTLRALPNELLAALIRGLEANEDNLVHGRLFTTRGGGGCAVGVMLRELRPDRFSPQRLRPWSIVTWRRTSASLGGEIGRNPRLRHLEWTFDGAVNHIERLCGISPTAAASLVGRWFRVDAQLELLRRGTDRQVVDATRRRCDRGLASENRAWQGRRERGVLEKHASDRGRRHAMIRSAKPKRICGGDH
jgi:hypothetical protein